MRHPIASLLSVLFLAGLARAATPATADQPFALAPLTAAQVTAASPCFTVDGKPVTPLAKLPGQLTDLAVLRLWPEAAPGQSGDDLAKDIPTLTVLVPPTGRATGAAVIVLPGGGYDHLSAREGLQGARWLAANGITAFILKYRYGPKYHHPVELGDAQRAIRLVRAHAVVWGLDPHRLGILGFSAGGHLASTAATHFDTGNPMSRDPVENASSRPDLHILLYPVITFTDEPNVHPGSRRMLLGTSASRDDAEALSNDTQVTADTPPAFVVHSITDTTVTVQNSDRYVAALQVHNVPYAYLRGQYGKHGFGVTDDWSGAALAWLRARGF
jgi:acetyl esterase/lipase